MAAYVVAQMHVHDLEKYGVDYCDRTVSMSESARLAVEKIVK